MKIVQRNIGRAGSRQQMLEQQSEWNKTYGEGNWVTGYEVNGEFMTREEAIEKVYNASYFEYLDKHPTVVASILSYSDVFNPHALFTNSTDIQAATIKAYIKERNLHFKNTKGIPLAIGTWQPKGFREDILQKAKEMGLTVQGRTIDYPMVSTLLSPFRIKCLHDSSISVEEFWQSNAKCLAIKV